MTLLSDAPKCASSSPTWVMEKTDSALEYEADHASGCRAIGNKGKPIASADDQQNRHGLLQPAGLRQAPSVGVTSSDAAFETEGSPVFNPASAFRSQVGPAEMLRAAILNHIQYT